MNWYIASVIMCVKHRAGGQQDFPVYENHLLVSAPDHEAAGAKAEELVRRFEHEDDESFTWDGHPARMEYLGVRKTIEVMDGPRDGEEVNYSLFVLDTYDDVQRLAGGEAVKLLYAE